MSLRKNYDFFHSSLVFFLKPNNFSFLLNVSYALKFSQATFRIHPCVSLANKEVQTVLQFHLKVIKFVVKVQSVHDCKKLIAIFSKISLSHHWTKRHRRIQLIQERVAPQKCTKAYATMSKKEIKLTVFGGKAKQQSFER